MDLGEQKAMLELSQNDLPVSHARRFDCVSSGERIDPVHPDILILGPLLGDLQVQRGGGLPRASRND